MAVSRTLDQISLTESSNNPQGTDSIGSDLDDYLRNLAVNIGRSARAVPNGTVSAAYTMVAGDLHKLIEVDTTTADLTVSAATAAAAGSGFIAFIRKSVAANKLIIDGHSSETINGATTLTLTASGQAVMMVCTGSAWVVPFVSARQIAADNVDITQATALSASASAVASSADYLLLQDASDSNATKRALVQDVVNSTAPVAASQALQEAAASTTTYVSPGRQQFHPSASKAWLVFEGSGTATIQSSFNITSLADNGTGNYAVTIGTDFSSAWYAPSGMARTVSGFGGVIVTIGATDTIQAGILPVRTANNSGTAVDSDTVAVVMYGDQ